MHIFTQAKCRSHLIFKCDHNMVISKVIGHEMSELCEFYNMSPQNGKFWLTLLVLQIAVTEAVLILQGQNAHPHLCFQNPPPTTFRAT